jgi:hypothetical protein
MDRVKEADGIFRMRLLLLRSPLQFTFKELAAKYDVNIRSIYHDLAIMANDLRRSFSRKEMSRGRRQRSLLLKRRCCGLYQNWTRRFGDDTNIWRPKTDHPN